MKSSDKQLGANISIQFMYKFCQHPICLHVTSYCGQLPMLILIYAVVFEFQSYFAPVAEK